jgi:P pilus assembly chaperone PapD
MDTGRSGPGGRGRAHCGAVVLALLVGLMLPPAAARAQVAVDELEMHFQPGAGTAAATRLVPVRNEQDRVQQVRVVLGDWVRDSLGRNVFLEAGSHASSCGERLRVFPMTFQVAPGGVENVRITYDPADDRAGCWSIVFFESAAPPSEDRQRPGSYLTIEVRTGVKVYVHAPRAVRAGEITFADVVEAWQPRQRPGAPRDSVRVRQADLRFVNTGTAHLKVRPTVEIRDAGGKLLHKVNGPEGYMTPRSLRDFAIALPGLASGEYVALMLLDYGGDEITAAQVEFRVP